MMTGMMMDTDLTVTAIMRHALRVYPDQEIVSVTADRPVLRYRYRDAFARSTQLAHALKELGIEVGDCVGTIACNDHRHLEAYYAISCQGAICHTINPRLHGDQITYIVNHSEDRVLLVDPLFFPIVEALADRFQNRSGSSASL